MATPQSVSFGKFLKRFRRAAGLTQEQLAERAGYSAAYVSMLERNARPPTRETVAQLADALSLDATDRANLLAATLAAPLAATAASSDTTPISAAPGMASGMAGAAIPPFVGRKRERLAIASHLAGHVPPLLLLAGEPGIGKSRLLRETAAQAREQGWTVLEGGCHRRGGQAPYAPLLGALQSRLRRQTLPQMRADLQGCTWLVRLLPELADAHVVPAPQWSLASEQESRLMFAAVGRYLTNIAGPAGTLLLLDDLQWARADALDLLAFLTRAAGDMPLRLIGAYRNTDTRAGDPLVALRAELVEARSATGVELGHLADDDAAELLEHLLEGSDEAADAGLMDQMMRRAGGNPFFLVSFARGVLTGALGGATGLPLDVMETTRQRVAALPESAQRVLEVAALIGRRIPRTLLFAVARHLGGKARSLLEGVEAACQARLLQEFGEQTYVFTHDLIREVISGDLSSARRATLHGWIAVALERARGASPPFPDTALPQLAYHFSRADRPDRAVEYLELAGDQALAMCAYGDAQRAFEDLVTRLTALGLPLESARARVKLGTALRGAARYDDAIAALRRAAEGYTSAGDRASAGRVVAQAGMIEAIRGTPEEGIGQLRAFLAQPEASAIEPAVQATIFLALVQLCRTGGHYTDMLAAAEAAAAQAAAARDDGLRAKAEQDRGTALLMLGRNEEGARALEAAMPGLENLGDPVALARALNTLSVVREARGDFMAGRQYLERAMISAERSDDPTLIAFIVNRRATNAFARGDWQDARAGYERAITTLRQISRSWASPYPLMGMGRIDLAMGLWESAAHYLDEAAATAERLGDIQAQQGIASIRAEPDVLAGDAPAVLARLQPLFERTERQSDAAILFPPLIWAYDRLGEAQRADALLERALRAGESPNGRLEMTNVRRAQAQVAARRGAWAAAERAAKSSLALCRHMHLPYGEAQALFVLGQVYAATGAQGRARASFGAAHDICARLGERLYAAAIDESLARIHATP